MSRRQKPRQKLLRKRLDGLAELATLTESQAQLDQINREAERLTRQIEALTAEEKGTIK